jgi:hypothetical protein
MNATGIIEAYFAENGFEDINGFEGLYKINPRGEIWNCKFKRVHSQIEKSGKKYTNLTKDGKVKKYSIEFLLGIQDGSSTLKKEEFDLTGYEDLKGFEGKYKINREGMVWSCSYEKTMTPHESEDGYFKIKLHITEHKSYHTGIHRLLGIQYLENPDNLPEIDHIDRNQKNNDLSNLRWVDKKTQNNNKSNILTEEQKEIRKVEIREYKRVKAEEYRREKGVQPKKVYETEEERKEAEREYKREWQAIQRAERTPEQREEDNRKKREARANKLASMSEEELKAFRETEKARTKRTQS